MPLKPLAALWTNTDKHGNKYLGGKLEDGRRCYLFKNTRRKGDTEPEYRLLVDVPEDEAQQPEAQPAARQPPRGGVTEAKYQERRQAAKAFVPPEDDVDDAIPF